MEQYIRKSALVAEIEDIESTAISEFNSKHTRYSEAGLDICHRLKTFINTLEAKEVEESTAADRGMAEEIIINLKRVEQDYHIDLTKEMEWIRNKSRKGE